MPRDLRSIKKTKFSRSSDWPLYRRFIVLISVILILLIGTYFAGLILLSNLDIFWGTVAPNGSVGPSDNIAPSPPTTFSLPEATNSATIKISGFAEPGGNVKLLVNNSEKDSQIADKEGKFTFTDVKLETGQNQIVTVVKDKAGNESQPSRSQAVVFDKEPPSLEVTAPENGNIIKEEKGKQTFLAVSGQVEEGTRVTVNGNLAIVRDEGKFEYRLLLLKEGDNRITIEAQDAAGNKTTVGKTVIYKKFEKGSESES